MGLPNLAKATGTNPNSSISAAITRMASSDDPSARALAAQLSSTYGVTGTGQQAQSSLSLLDQVKHAAGVAANYAAPVLNLINRPSQAVLHGVQDVAQGTGNPLVDAAKAFIGQNEDINLRQAILGNDQGGNNLGLDKGGLAAGAIDTIGSAALDPLTLLGGPIAKGATKGISLGAKAIAATDKGAAVADRLAPVTDKLQSVKNALVPGARLQSDLGTDAGKTAQQGIQSATEDALQQTGDVNNQLNALIKQSGATDDEIKNVITPAIEAGGADTLAQHYAASGDALKADLVTKLNAVFNPEAVGKDVTVPGRTFSVLGEAPLVEKTVAAKTYGMGAEQGSLLDNSITIPETVISSIVDPAVKSHAAMLKAQLDAMRTPAEKLKYANTPFARHVIGEMAEKLNVKPAQVLSEGSQGSLFSDAVHVPEHTVTVEGERPVLTKTTQDQTVRVGAEKQQPLFKSATALPLELSKAGAKAFTKNGEGFANALGVNLGDLNKAVETGDLSHIGGTSLNEIESKLAEAGVIKPGKLALNHDVVNLAAKQAKQAAEAEGKQKLLTQTLHDVTDHTGQKIVLGEADKALAVKRGFVPTELADGTKVYVHPAVKRAMNDISTVINEDKTVDGFDKTLKHLNRLWKGYAVLSPHFHSQNLFGNAFMNTVAGMRNPVYYTRALRIQKVMAGLSKSTEGFEAALKKADLSPKDRKIIEGLRKEHIADSSFSHAILNNPRTLKGSATGVVDKAKELASKFNPLDEGNFLTTGNKAVGSLFENNSRIAHFMWAMEKNGGNTAAARLSVAKHLFDYNALTPLERKRLQPVIPFYTYMRKNTPAQLALLAEHPGFYANYGKLQNNLQQHGPDDGTQWDPTKLANGSFPIQLPGMSSPLLANPTSPFYSAFSQLTPLGDAAALVPGSPTANKVATPGANLFQNLLQPVGGLTGGLAKYAAEEATGKNLNTGGNIKPGENLKLLASTVLPPAGLVQRTTKAAETGNKATLLNNLAGIPVSQGGDAATNATLQGRLADVQAALAALQGKIGKDNVPTLTALRKAGKAPKVHTTRRKRAKTKSTKKSHHKKA